MTREKARELAFKGFEGIFDSQGKPYFEHCEIVAQSENEDEAVVGYLHDTIENKIYTMEYLLSEGLTIHQGALLDVLTHKDNVKYKDYIENIVKSGYKEAIKIKMRDLEHNSDIKRMKYCNEKHFNRLIKYCKSYYFLKQNL